MSTLAIVWFRRTKCSRASEIGWFPAHEYVGCFSSSCQFTGNALALGRWKGQDS